MKKYQPDFIGIGALMLAVIGSLWGLFLAYFIWVGDTRYGLLIFGPGYVVVIGYFLRAFIRLPTGYRKTIWVASCLVQGTWLQFGIYDAIWRRTVYPVLIWWIFAFTFSLCVKILDHE